MELPALSAEKVDLVIPEARLREELDSDRR